MTHRDIHTNIGDDARVLTDDINTSQCATPGRYMYDTTLTNCKLVNPFTRQRFHRADLQ